MIRSGLYIVTLTNEHPISVNAQDPRRADKTIKVTREHCKFGKAKVLDGRKKNYDKTFGAEYVSFTPIAVLEEITSAEKAILKKLDPYRLRGKTGRKNEWLGDIDSVTVIAIIKETLLEIGVEHQLL